MFIPNLPLANGWGSAYIGGAQAIFTYQRGLMADLGLKQIGIVLSYRGPYFRKASRSLSQHKPDKWLDLSKNIPKPAKHFIQGIYLKLALFQLKIKCIIVTRRFWDSDAFSKYKVKKIKIESLELAFL